MIGMYNKNLVSVAEEHILKSFERRGKWALLEAESSLELNDPITLFQHL